MILLQIIACLANSSYILIAVGVDTQSRKRQHYRQLAINDGAQVSTLL